MHAFNMCVLSALAHVVDVSKSAKSDNTDLPAKGRVPSASIEGGNYPSTQVIGAPLAAGILYMDGLGGLRGWQWLFILEGAVTAIYGVVLKVRAAALPLQSASLVGICTADYTLLLPALARLHAAFPMVCTERKVPLGNEQSPGLVPCFSKNDSGAKDGALLTSRAQAEGGGALP